MSTFTVQGYKKLMEILPEERNFIKESQSQGFIDQNLATFITEGTIESTIVKDFGRIPKDALRPIIRTQSRAERSVVSLQIVPFQRDIAPFIASKFPFVVGNFLLVITHSLFVRTKGYAQGLLVRN